MTERRYDEHEADAILERAARLQGTAAASSDPRAMTLAEIEQAAEEAGIERALVRRAARELDAASGPRALAERSTAVPGPLALLRWGRRWVETRTVDGVLSRADLETLVERLQQDRGVVGQVFVTDRGLKWSIPSNPQGQTDWTTVEVRSDAGSTAVEVYAKLGGAGVYERMPPWQNVLMMGGFVAIMVATAWSNSGLVPLVLMPTWFVIAEILSRRRRVLRLARLADRVGAECRRLAAGPGRGDG